MFNGRSDIGNTTAEKPNQSRDAIDASGTNGRSDAIDLSDPGADDDDNRSKLVSESDAKKKKMRSWACLPAFIFGHRFTRACNVAVGRYSHHWRSCDRFRDVAPSHRASCPPWSDQVKVAILFSTSNATRLPKDSVDNRRLV